MFQNVLNLLSAVSCHEIHSIVGYDSGDKRMVRNEARRQRLVYQRRTECDAHYCNETRSILSGSTF